MGKAWDNQGQPFRKQSIRDERVGRQRIEIDDTEAFSWVRSSNLIGTSAAQSYSRSMGSPCPMALSTRLWRGQEKRRRSCPASSMSSSRRSTRVVVTRAGSPERPTRDDADLANKEIDDERDAIAVASVLAPGAGT